MTEKDFLKKYQRKLGAAWRAGCTDEQAAKHAGCSYSELEIFLSESPTLRNMRDDLVDKLLLKAQQNIAKKIQDGDIKASEWYIEKMDHRFGGKDFGDIPEVSTDDELDNFLDGFTAKGHFDEQ